jgi:hypothetical protein
MQLIGRKKLRLEEVEAKFSKVQNAEKFRFTIYYTTEQE